jgi:phosphoribosyl 1,2-cyclic phosphodiesterase
MSAYVKFWGTRGSIPTPSNWTRVYGGNTSCVEVRFDDTVFICDAGSGIREMGKDLMTRSPRPQELHLLLTHTHWDHIQGFPFFVPAYESSACIRVYGPTAGDDSRHRLLSGQMSSDYFPVSFGELGARIVADDLAGGEKTIAGVRVRSFPLNHPGGCSGYIFEKDGVKIVYATDNELLSTPACEKAAPLIEAARDATLLITDAQYDDAQYEHHRGWGHSSCSAATDLALQADVQRLALFHHDPESSDRELDARVAACSKRATLQGSSLIIFAAREGVELKF